MGTVSGDNSKWELFQGITVNGNCFRGSNSLSLLAPLSRGSTHKGKTTPSGLVLSCWNRPHLGRDPDLRGANRKSVFL